VAPGVTTGREVRPLVRAGDEFSAGGVVVNDLGETIVIVPTRRAADGSTVLALPKGHPDGDESAEDAALREVREETGVDAEVLDALGDVRYWYQRDGRRVAKVVSFFLLRYRAGSLDDHDAEVEHARWVPLAEAVETLTYAGEREMAARALSRIAEGG
jgi:8-oxo-dGTP pyrophosphatase MutT (NUDIX family)